MKVLYRCPECNGILNVEYDLPSSLAEKLQSKKFPVSTSIWEFDELLPVKTEYSVTMGEGGTPLLSLDYSRKEENLSNWFLKNESIQPTGAFKDRPLAVAVSFAKEHQLKGIITASTGNTAVAASAYAAKSGMYCKIYVPQTASSEKLQLMHVYGADVVPIEGNFSEAYHIVKEEAVKTQLFNVTSTFINPIAIEGNKTVAYELWYQLQKQVPDWIVVPIGAGPLLIGVYKGFQELKQLGLTKKLPRMVGVQAENVSPIVQAYREGSAKVSGWDKGTGTSAVGIADPLTNYPEDGTRTLSVIRESEGTAVRICEKELLQERKDIASKEGILLEISAAAAVTAVKKIRGSLQEKDIVISVGTGHGLKDLSITK
ncbi:threonine synthase [Alkalicoccus daliensis]|uniref:threonine synthase n=1 Tax=Alkalicoccus daliensis TaxID=745820 RepID=UPI0011131D1F|nr:threonine synthase [Alkalicoccus daliensis]